VAWLDTVVDIFGRIGAGSLVGANRMRSHIRLALLRSLEDVLAAHTERWLEVGIQFDVGRQM
jgi:hypothetical protein